jgi:hypothetical protein
MNPLVAVGGWLVVAVMVALLALAWWESGR